MTEVICDFETCNPYCDVTAVGSTVYAQHWATEILCLSYTAEGVKRLWTPLLAHRVDVINDLAGDPNVIFIAHSAGFEKDIWREIMVPVYGFPDIPNERWHDTQAVAALKAVPLKLEKVLPVLGLGAKDKEGSKITIGLSRWDVRKGPKSKPNPNFGQLPSRTSATMQRVYDYCGKDVDDEVALHARLGPLPPSEKEVWLLDQRINERGVLLDRDFVVGAQRVVEAARSPLVAEFVALTALEPGQTAAVVKWVQDQGVDLPNLQKGTIAELLGESEEDDEDALEGRVEYGVCALPTNVRRALAIRSLVGSSSISKLSRMGSCIARDGRVHRLLQYHGTGPGRWAGRLFNPLNFPRGLVREPFERLDKNGVPYRAPPDPDLLALAITSGDPDVVDMLETVAQELDQSWRPANPIEVVASSLRHAIWAGPGRRLVVGDFAGIQARTVLALAGQHDKTALMAAGVDVYLNFAEEMFHLPPGSLDPKRDVEKRQKGKGGVLGCGFQCGPDNFCLKFMPACLCRRGWAGKCRLPDSEPRQQSSLTGSTYRQKWAPQVPKLWYALEEAALRTVWDQRAHEAYGIRYELEDGWLTARLLDGKKIYYWNPQRLPGAETRFGKDAWTYQATKQGQLHTIAAYGGLLTENVVMGLERQLLVRAMFQCEKENLPVIFNGYDEIVCEPEEARASWPALKQIMEDTPAWACEIKLPVAAEGWTGQRYRKG